MRQSFSDGKSERVLRVAKMLTGWESERNHMKLADARNSVARQAGIAPGSLARLEAGRLKFVDRIGDKLDELLIKIGQRQIKSIENEMALARARLEADHHLDPDAFEAEMAQARLMLEAAKRRLRR